MIEREAQLARERPLVSAVIYNRLKEGMTLRIDATIRYATNNWQRPIRESELETPGPYNTRAQPRAAADADRQPRARVVEGRRQAREQELPVLRPQGQRASPASTRSPPPTRSSRRTSSATTTPAKASDPARGVRVAGGPLALAADAQRGARACSACTTGATSTCRSRRTCSSRPSARCRRRLPRRQRDDPAQGGRARARRRRRPRRRARSARPTRSPSRTAGSTPTTPTPAAS